MDRSNQSIYLDYQSTTPCDPKVIEAMMPYFANDFGNPSSRDHVHGSLAAEAVERSRKQVADMIGARSEEILFVSSTTEANHLAILGTAASREHKGKHIISARTEHRSVLGPLSVLGKKGYTFTWLDVDALGNVDMQQLESSIRRDTVLVTLMHGNNEIGTLHPLEQIGQICKRHGVLFHTDAAQTVGREPIEVNACSVDLLSLSSHKIYGPKGIAALYIRESKPRIKLTPWLVGGGQEQGLRSSTLNVPGIVGMGTAYEVARTTFLGSVQEAALLRERFARHVVAELPGVQVHGNAYAKLINNWSISVPNIGRAKDFLRTIPSLSISTGSSCSSVSLEPSHVLLAIGLSEEQALSTFRFSFGKFLTNDQIDLAAKIFVEKVKEVRSTGKYAK